MWKSTTISGASAVAKEGDAALILYRTHAQCSITDKEQCAAHIAGSQQIRPYRNRIKASAASHRHIQTESGVGQTHAVLKYARSGGSAVISGHRLEDKHIDAIAFPSEFLKQCVGGLLTHVGGADTLRSDMAAAYTYGIVEYLGLLRSHQRDILRGHHLLGHTGRHTGHAHIIDSPFSHMSSGIRIRFPPPDGAGSPYRPHMT